MRKFLSLLPDGFTLAIAGTVVFASFFPCFGEGAKIFGWLTVAAIAMMFFMQGAKLSREAVVAGLGHWRLHLAILGSTFILFPILGFGFRALFPHLMNPALLIGLLYICLLPSTVQSSIAFTSIAQGNVPAAICAATFSTLVGVIVTPIMASLLLKTHGETGGFHTLLPIFLELLLPFITGQVVRPWIAGWMDRNRGALKFTDRLSVVLVVYTAFSAAVMRGLWHALPLAGFAEIVLSNAVLLALVLLITTYGSRGLGYDRADEIAVVFCGSKKSAATGVPMANVLFGATNVGLIVVPLIIFHQMQLMVCAVLAKRYARRNAMTVAQAGRAVERQAAE
jgi:sodium/bile acid cotransporter 7